jgi:hypothetical protein
MTIVTPNEVQGMPEELANSEALQPIAEKSPTKIGNTMSLDVARLDISKTAADAVFDARKIVGIVIVTKNGRPFAN